MHIEDPKILVTNDLNAYTNMELADVDMAIRISEDGNGFHIVKNRHGVTTTKGNALPIELLPKVMANPTGIPKVTVTWE